MASWSRIATRVRVPLGFAFAAAYLWLAKPDWIAIAIGVAAVVAGLAVRAAASGHIRKNAELTITGPYAYTRNPLYLGSILIAAGFLIAARSIWIVAATLVMFIFIYLPVVRAEEKYLQSAFPGYNAYAQGVPRFFPRFTPFAAATGNSQSFSWGLYRRHREYNAAIGSALMMGAIILKILLVKH